MSERTPQNAPRPSEVQKWTRCPTLWLYEDVQSWAQPGPVRTDMLMGTAFHAGMAHWWRVGNEDQASQAASHTLEEGWPVDEAGLTGMVLLLNRMLEATQAWCRTNLPDVERLLIEHPMRDDGHATPDLVIRERGGITVIDWKTHLECKPEHLPYRLQDPEHVHQFQDYVWRVGEYFKEPVRLFRAVHIVGLPKLLVKETTFVPDAVQQAEWLRQAKRKWHLMELMLVDHGLVYRNEGGCKPYGEKYPCPMWTACWTCHGSQEAISQFYTKKGAQ